LHNCNIFSCKVKQNVLDRIDFKSIMTKLCIVDVLRLISMYYKRR